ncbi:MAG: OstA-like protein [Bacteroidales bacterium]|nr:OstA-like protein [Bacteroidales bacterium]MDY0347763.1 OstA-like protein [Tenuifilaceae bacterium]
MISIRKIAVVLLLGFSLQISHSNAIAQGKREIIIEHADNMRNLRINELEVRRLIGNVVISHDGTIVHCDSLYDYAGQNRFDAFGNVKVFQKTGTLYGDTLRFNGETKQGKVRGKTVRLVDDDVTLITRFLDFETRENTANFFGGGIITSSDSARFSSLRGKFFSKEKVARFAGNVAYRDTSILLNTDSLEYYDEQELIKFYGPTRIYNDSSYLFCQHGQYNRETQNSEFHGNAFIDNGAQKVYGNSILYDSNNGEAKVIDEGCVIDTLRNITIYGNSLYYNQETEYAQATENPLAVYTQQSDTLYLRADKLIGLTVKDSIKTDSTLHNLLVGVGDVQFFRNDIQGVCDSMLYHSIDSIMYMHIEPILWNENNQLTANDVKILFKNQNISQMNFNGSSFVASQEDSTRFNQIKGREMVGYFTKGALSKLDINGNGETVYYIRDKGEIVGVNKAVSSNLSIGIRDNEVTNIMFRDKPVATLYPIDKAELQNIMVKGFMWHIDKRPKSSQSIIPSGLNLSFYKPIEQKANSYRVLKVQPAYSLNDITFGAQDAINDPDKTIPANSLEKAGDSKNFEKLEKFNTRLR